jgi:uncharacterized protein (TIGR02246 family)
MKMSAARAAMVAALIVVAVAPATAGNPADTAAVWQRHVERATARDLDAVMEDFAEDSVIITPEGVIAGEAAIRAFFADFLAGFDQAAIESTVVNAQTIHDDVVVFNFTVGTAGMTFHDTAVIRDDRIRVLATVGYPAQ